MKLYKPREAAELIFNANTKTYGVSVARVCVLCRAGRLGQRVGGGWVISAEDIARFNKLDRREGAPVTH